MSQPPTMNEKSVYRCLHLLHKLEADGRLLSVQVDGFSVWPVIRARFWQLLTGIQPDPFHGSLWRRIRHRPGEWMRLVWAAYALWQRRRLPKRRDPIVILSSEAYRSVRRDDGWWDVYLDDVAIHPSLADQVIRIETRAQAWPRSPAVAPRHLFTDAQLVNQVVGSLMRRDPLALDTAQRLCDIIHSERKHRDLEHITTNSTGFVPFAIKRIAMFRRALRWYRHLFARIRPGILVIVDAANQHAPVAAALERNIAVIEVQHGDIPSYHVGYSWPAVAQSWRDCMPIPTHLATYGTHWTNSLLRSGFWTNDRVVSVGSVRMDWIRKQCPSPQGLHESVRILFTSQKPIQSEAIIMWRMILSSLRNLRIPCELTIKLHRMERDSFNAYDQLRRFCASLKIVGPYEGDTLTMIADSDLHVSGWSTCHFEALGLGVPTVVLRCGRVHVPMEHPENAHLHFADSPEHFIEIIRHLTSHRPARDPHLAKCSQELFTPGAIDNMIALVQRLRTPKQAP